MRVGGGWRCKHSRRAALLRASGLYVHAARELKARYGVRRILLATDSTDVPRQLQQQCVGCDEFEWVYLDFDRKAVGGGDHNAAATGLANFIEFRKGVDYDLAFTSYRVERQLLRRADFFVGTATSVVTREPPDPPRARWARRACAAVHSPRPAVRGAVCRQCVRRRIGRGLLRLDSPEIPQKKKCRKLVSKRTETTTCIITHFPRRIASFATKSWREAQVIQSTSAERGGAGVDGRATRRSPCCCGASVTRDEDVHLSSACCGLVLQPR